MADTLFQETLEAWRYAREGVTAELENIPAESFGFSPAPAVRSISDLARHILESGAMMAGELSRPDGNFTRQGLEAFLREYAPDVSADADKPTLIGQLRDSFTDGKARLEAAGEIHMLQRIVQFNGEPATRLSWMNHGIAHEEYHRGQLALYARLLGRVPALTQLIHGA
ncbi:MAG: DinB family protein [Acidobacteriota bacterium]